MSVPLPTPEGPQNTTGRNAFDMVNGIYRLGACCLLLVGSSFRQIRVLLDKIRSQIGSFVIFGANQTTARRPFLVIVGNRKHDYSSFSTRFDDSMQDATSALRMYQGSVIHSPC